MNPFTPEWHARTRGTMATRTAFAACVRVNCGRYVRICSANIRIFALSPNSALTGGAVFRECDPVKSSLLLLLCVCALVPSVKAQSAVEPPVAVRTVAPVYPDSLKREGVSGIVTVKFTVDVNGNVLEPQVEKSSNPAFNAPALEALTKWRFKPAQQNGAPVAIKIAVPIKFSAET